MKRMIIVVLLFAGLTAGAADDYRDFIAKGKPVRARVLRFDARKQIVTVETDAKKTVKVPLNIFSEKDQEYVLTWEFNKIFLSERSFVIEAKRKRVKNKDESYSGYATSKKVENVAYEVTLKNKSTSELKNIDVEYCIYYEQDEHRGTKEGVRYGTLDIAGLSPKSEREVLTKSVTIYTDELDADWIYGSGAKNKQSGSVRGIWLRVNMKLENGETLTRNYCLPDSLNSSKAWATSSQDAGMNNSSKN